MRAEPDRWRAGCRGGWWVRCRGGRRRSSGPGGDRRGLPARPFPLRGARFGSHVPRVGPRDGTVGGDRRGLATKGGAGVSTRTAERAGRPTAPRSRDRCLPGVMGHGQRQKLPNGVRSRHGIRGRPDTVNPTCTRPG